MESDSWSSCGEVTQEVVRVPRGSAQQPSIVSPLAMNPGMGNVPPYLVDLGVKILILKKILLQYKIYS